MSHLSADMSPSDGLPGLQIVSVRSLAGSEHDVPSGGQDQNQSSAHEQDELMDDEYVDRVIQECKRCGKGRICLN